MLPVVCFVAGGVVDDPDERLVGIRGRVQRVDLGLAHGASRPDVVRREDAAHHRDQVRQEVDRDRARVRVGLETGIDRGVRQLLLDLGDVAMPAEAVRLHALVDLAEHHLGLRVSAGA